MQLHVVWNCALRQYGIEGWASSAGDGNQRLPCRVRFPFPAPAVAEDPHHTSYSTKANGHRKLCVALLSENRA